MNNSFHSDLCIHVLAGLSVRWFIHPSIHPSTLPPTLMEKLPSAWKLLRNLAGESSCGQSLGWPAASEAENHISEQFKFPPMHS